MQLSQYRYRERQNIYIDTHIYIYIYVYIYIYIYVYICRGESDLRVNPFFCRPDTTSSHLRSVCGSIDQSIKVLRVTEVRVSG